MLEPFLANKVMKKESLPQLWEITLQFLYDKQYIESLVAFLREQQIQSILDCACGTGFPAIELKKAGFDLYCTDGSEAMIRQFRHNLEKEKLDIPNQVSDWPNLGKLDRKFDAVLCRGNSFIYVDSWDEGTKLNPQNFLSHGLTALQGMYSVLNEGGLLYIDMPSKKEHESGPVLDENLGERLINGQMTKLAWHVTHDWDKRVRVVHSERLVDNEKFEHDYYSFLLKHEELQLLLRQVGFDKVSPLTLGGENGYDIYITKRLGSSITSSN